MLRTCNQLLRRLSKASDVVFCGRILMFLAHFFPLSEHSAVNIKEVFNRSNETKYEKDPPEDRVKKVLDMIPPKGKEFLCSIEHTLEHEKNWIWWKRDGCPPFEKQPIENKTVQDRAKKRRLRWRLGNKELSQSWKWADQNLNALTDPQRIRTPAIGEYSKPLAEDMDESAGIEVEYHHKNNWVYCWKALRFQLGRTWKGFLDLLDMASKELTKRSKKEETKSATYQVEENQIATPASENDGEGVRAEVEASAAPMDIDSIAAAANGFQNERSTPTPDEQKQISNMDVGQEAGHLGADTEVEAGVIDGETDAEVEVDAAGRLLNLEDISSC
ncbi:hypothetical protein SLA2020_368420 [Shorea laevis]